MSTQLQEAIIETSRTYAKTEELLRRATFEGNRLTVRDLMAKLNEQQGPTKLHRVQYVMKVLKERGCVDFEATGQYTELAYSWKPDAPPFTFVKTLEKREARRPSKPTVIRTEEAQTEEAPTETRQVEKHTFTKINPDLLPAVSEDSQEIEIVLGGSTIIIGRNAQTNRMRIIVEK